MSYAPKLFILRVWEMDVAPHANGNGMVMAAVCLFLSCVRNRAQYSLPMVMAVMGTRMEVTRVMVMERVACESEIGRKMKR